MTFHLTFNEEVPTKEEMNLLSKKGQENIKKGKTLEYFKKYNQFKRDAISNLQYARDTVFITGETKQYLNEYNDKDCQQLEEFVKRFNKEKITNIPLFNKDCQAYFDWKN